MARYFKTVQDTDTEAEVTWADKDGNYRMQKIYRSADIITLVDYLKSIGTIVIRVYDPLTKTLTIYQPED